MLGPEHTLSRRKHLALHTLSVGELALVCEGRSQIVRTRQRVRMIGPEHALSHLMHLVLDPLSVGELALV